MKLYDSHTHLNAEPLLQDWQSYIQKFVDIGGVGLVNSWASEAYNVQGIEIAKHVERLRNWDKPLRPSDTSPYPPSWTSQGREMEDVVIKATVGWHPDSCTTGDITEENLQQKILDLKLLYEENTDVVVAIGECGIDTYYPGSEDFLSLQKRLFTLQCDLAKELNLPLMVHIRRDFLSAFEILKNYHDMTIYIHCWWFGPEEVEILKRESVELWWNLFIGFCGNVTYKNAQNLRDSLSILPLDQLLLETDAPWLSPQVVRGTTNHPANVKYIYEFVADYLHMDSEQLALQIEKNFKAVYGI